MKLLGLVAALPLLAPAALAAPMPQPIVVELFTSEGCSSCPPADALLGELKRAQPELLPLDFHVDYWNNLGWKDPYSSAAATERQRGYAAALGADVYTPQLVVQGSRQVVGSDRRAVAAAIAAARTEAAQGNAVALALGWHDGHVAIDVGAGNGGGMLWLVGLDDQHATPVRAGENIGRTLTEVNVVRSLSAIGRWRGTSLHLEVAPPAGERGAVLLQGADGRIIAAARLPAAN